MHVTKQKNFLDGVPEATSTGVARVFDFVFSPRVGAGTVRLRPPPHICMSVCVCVSAVVRRVPPADR